MKSKGVTIQMKATEQYFPVVLFIIMLHKVVLTLESLDYRISRQHEGLTGVPFSYFIFLFYRRLNQMKMRMIYLGRKRSHQNQMRNKRKVKKRKRNLRR